MIKERSLIFKAASDKERYNQIIEEAAKLISPSKVALLKFGLALHIYSPKIEMFGQIADQLDLPDCLVTVDVGGKFICDISDVRSTIENVRIRPFEELVYIVSACLE